jgi:hypothetical protein
MKIEVLRKPSKLDYMEGVMLLDGILFGLTIEDCRRPNGVKVAGETAIPAGSYVVTVEPSPRFQKDLPKINNVPGFEGVLIHGGNSALDSHGCILVGTTYIKPGTIAGSLSAVLVTKLRAAGGKHSIVIYNSETV